MRKQIDLIIRGFLMPTKLKYRASSGVNLAVSNLGDYEENILTDIAEAEPKTVNDIVKALNANKNLYCNFSLSKRSVKDGCVVKVEDTFGNISFLAVYFKPYMGE